MTDVSARLPSLKDSKWLRLAALAVLYAGQGLPIGIFQVALPAYMASLNMSAAEVGGFISIAATALIGLLWRPIRAFRSDD